MRWSAWILPTWASVRRGHSQGPGAGRHEERDIDLWEVNEAFASQAVYCTKELGIRRHKLLNPRGSGISLGHPLGCTGARIAHDDHA
jgi:hypothetical protein